MHGAEFLLSNLYAFDTLPQRKLHQPVFSFFRYLFFVSNIFILGADTYLASMYSLQAGENLTAGGIHIFVFRTKGNRNPETLGILFIFSYD